MLIQSTGREMCRSRKTTKPLYQRDAPALRYHTRVLKQTFRATPKPLLLASAGFFCAAFVAVGFSDFPGAEVGSYVSTFLIALPPGIALFRYLGARRALLALVSLALFAYAIETIGVTTGVPYGEFRYGEALGPKVFGVVPYLLPVSYVPLVIGAVGVAATAAGGFVARVFVATTLLLLTDGVLDPGAVALGFWDYPGGGVYYGVPVSNYFGWLISGVIAAALLLVVGRGWRSLPPPGVLDGLVISAAFWSGVAVLSGLVVPALLGVVLFVYLLRCRILLAEPRSGID